MTAYYRDPVPMKISETIRFLEQDGWAMAEHIALLRQAGEPVPEPAEAGSVTILDPAAA